MPGGNCSVYGCSSSRKPRKGKITSETKEDKITIVKLPTVKDDKTQIWRDKLQSFITRDRVMDENLKRQIRNNSLHICELHFQENDFYICKYEILLDHFSMKIGKIGMKKVDLIFLKQVRRQVCKK